mgnify:CR=1 FL=1
MSNIVIKSSTTGTGTYTIEAPVTNTDRVLTLPADGILVTSTSSLSSANLTGALPAIDGSALVNAGNYVKTHSMVSNTISTLSTTLADIPGAAITVIRGDTTSGNKHVVTFGVATYNDTGGSGHGFSLWRKYGVGGSWTLLYLPADYWGMGGYGGGTADYVTITYADTVLSTESNVYYKLQGLRWSGADNVYVNYTGYSKQMTAVVMEVKA